MTQSPGRGGSPAPACFLEVRLDADGGFERGFAYGRAARRQIRVSAATYRRLFRDFAGVSWESARRMGEGFAEAVRRFDPDLLAEMEGIAEGSGLELSEILALNARSEIALTSPEGKGGCTAFAAFGRATRGAATLLCQNWDWWPSQRDAVVLLRVRRPGRPEVTTLTEAGIVGKIGFNAEGLGVCLNAIFTPEVRADGVPLHVVLRALLEAGSLDDAVATVARSRLASAANILLAQHGHGALDVEATPSGLEVLAPRDDVLAHTNHLCGAWPGTDRDLGPLRLPDTQPRLARVEALLRERRGELDVCSAHDVLCDHEGGPSSICRHGDACGDARGLGLETVLSVVMDLGQRRFSVTEGPPCGRRFAPGHGLGEATA